jgi:hypothetical protein
MAELHQLFDEFITAQLSGERPDPFAYVERAPAAEREELAELIEVYLERAPREAWDPEAFKGSSAEQALERVDRSLHGVSGFWPSLLPRLRMAAKLRRAELVSQLAQALGAPDSEAKVGRYYHEMEQGLLPSAGVSDRVLDALASIVGVGSDLLKRAGEAVATDAAGEPPPAVVHTRLAMPDPGYEAGQASPAVSRADEEDEIDRLFRDG